MKKTFRLLASVILAGIALCAAHAREAKMPAWQDPGLVQENREPMTATFETDGLKLSLNGVWKFNWNQTPDSRPLDFYKLDY